MLDQVLADDPTTSARIVAHLVAQIPADDRSGHSVGHGSLVAALAAHPNRDVPMTAPVADGRALVARLTRSDVDARGRALLLELATPAALATYTQYTADPDLSVWDRMADGLSDERTPVLAELFTHPRAPRALVADALAGMTPEQMSHNVRYVDVALARHDLLTDLAHTQAVAISNLPDALDRRPDLGTWDAYLSSRLARTNYRWPEIVLLCRDAQVSDAAMAARGTLPTWGRDPSYWVAGLPETTPATRAAALANVIADRPGDKRVSWTEVSLGALVRAGDLGDQLATAGDLAAVLQLLMMHGHVAEEVSSTAWESAVRLSRSRRWGGVRLSQVALTLAARPNCPTGTRRTLRRWFMRQPRSGGGSSLAVLGALTDPRRSLVEAVAELPMRDVRANWTDLHDLVGVWVRERSALLATPEPALLTALALERAATAFASLDELWSTAVTVAA